jgi:hypothetical protein
VYYESPQFFNSNRSVKVLDAWSPSNPNGTYPALSETILNNEFSQSNSFFIRDGSFVRLRSLQIGYTLSDSVVSKIGASSARIFYNGTNLLTLTDFDGFDPEVPNGGSLLLGWYDGQYPLKGTSSIGLNIKF